MSLNFSIFRNALSNHFKKMCKDNEMLYSVDLDKDKLYELYLNSIPAEDNKIFRVRKEYDCSACRHFIKNIGNVVAIKDSKVISIWDFTTPENGWNIVTETLSDFVKLHPITNVFLSNNPFIGIDYSMDNKELDNPIKWEHLYVSVPNEYIFKGRYRETIDTKLGEYRDSKNVFKRSLDEFSLETVDTILDLINQGSLYRGGEYKDRIVKFRNFEKEYSKLAEDVKDIYAWEKSVSLCVNIANARVNKKNIKNAYIRMCLRNSCI